MLLSSTFLPVETLTKTYLSEILKLASEERVEEGRALGEMN